MTRGRERERGYELKLFGNMALLMMMMS